MENIELIFENVDIKKLEQLMFKELDANKDKIISSHFYDNETERDIEFKELDNLVKYFSVNGTGNVFLKALRIGLDLSNVMVVMSFDDRYGDVVLNFDEEELMKHGKIDKDKCDTIIEKATEIRKNINNDRVIMGFEPATDEDMMLFNIDSSGVQRRGRTPLDV